MQKEESMPKHNQFKEGRDRLQAACRIMRADHVAEALRRQVLETIQRIVLEVGVRDA